MPTRRANRRRSLRGRCVSLPTSERARTGAEERTVLLRGTLERHLDVVERSRVAKRGGQEGRVPPAHLGRRRLVAVARVVKLDQVLKVTVFGEVAAAGKVAEKAVVAVGPLCVRTQPSFVSVGGRKREQGTARLTFHDARSTMLWLSALRLYVGKSSMSVTIDLVVIQRSDELLCGAPSPSSRLTKGRQHAELARKLRRTPSAGTSRSSTLMGGFGPSIECMDALREERHVW